MVGGPASATLVDSVFTQSNIFPTDTVQDWGTLHIDCNGTTCSGSLTSLGNSDAIFDTNFLSVNLASGASDFAISTAVSTDCLNPQTCGNFQTNQTVDGLGSFQYTINLPDGPSHGVDDQIALGTILFTVTYGGTADSLLVENSSGFDAAIHFLVTASDDVTTCTGFAGEGSGTNGGTSPCSGGPPPVPEPATLALIGVGLLGVSLMMRRRRAN